ncbi:Developmental regulator flbA [Neolecta irregularis DAH-3]|uniref:Developmental regulator flbA n=1 Tax=Neolecta irregularis (strain DAH-3) TaxID=1198029 RepID=A0A1U7LVT4_NEOID|nr:Developmental regulator flbA [Neolecta irregularis DAH-3]|eukprot:OLL26683.1 Developmental regulator flbA [Neolecta irregularis DAH-3]
MAKDMAKSLCQRFFDARFFENAVDSDITLFKDKCLWQLTPKGIAILQRFVYRNGITADHVSKLLQSPLNTMQLVILEREERMDKLSHDKTSIEILFGRFVGKKPNLKNSSTLSDSDSVSEYSDGLSGVKLLDRRQVGEQYIYNSFTGRTGARWLMDCSTIMDPVEVVQIATSFLEKGLIESANEVSREQQAAGRGFFVSKYSIYAITARGKRIAWESSPIESRPNSERISLQQLSPPAYLADKSVNSPSSIENSNPVKSNASKPVSERETNGSKLESILNNPPQRMLFAEFLRENFCEENLSFYTDLTEFMRDATTALSLDRIRDCIAGAYGIYNRFLAPGSPNELNLESSLRLDMATRMTRAVGSDDKKMRIALKEIIELLERARKQVFKLMAGDSVPKFVRTPGYREIAGNEEDEGIMCTPPGTPGN